MVILVMVFLVGVVAFHALERLAPIRSEYPTGPARRGYAADLLAATLHGPALSGLTRLGAVALIMAAPRLPTPLGRWSWTAQFCAFLLVNDFGRYWLHRWHHESDWLWRLHRVHHTVTHMDSMSVFRVHALEAAIKYGVMVLPFRCMGITESVILVYSGLDLLKGFWHHANLRTRIGPLNYLFNSAELHWWHHSDDPRGQHANYGSMLSVWDRLFGTFHYVKGRWPESIGVKGMQEFPDSYVGQLISVAQPDEAFVGQARSQGCMIGAAPIRQEAPAEAEGDPGPVVLIPRSG